MFQTACLRVSSLALLFLPHPVAQKFRVKLPDLRKRDANSCATLRLTVNPDCVTAFNELKLGRGGPKYIIYKISDDQKEIVVDEIGKEADYNVFREKLVAAKEKSGKSRPSYAIYDVDFELEGGEGKRSVLVA